MSEINSKGPALVQAEATLTLEYRDGQPVLLATGGNAIPGEIQVLDPLGTPVARYTPSQWEPRSGRPFAFITPLSKGK
ncbi:hypothetical protein [Streptomyces sp. NPDC005046]